MYLQHMRWWTLLTLSYISTKICFHFRAHVQAPCGLRRPWEKITHPCPVIPYTSSSFDHNVGRSKPRGHFTRCEQADSDHICCLPQTGSRLQWVERVVTVSCFHFLVTPHTCLGGWLTNLPQLLGWALPECFLFFFCSFRCKICILEVFDILFYCSS